jgi:hypothetical protein
VTLSVPYYLVPRSRSNLEAELEGDVKSGAVSVKLSNAGAKVAANADFYALGLRGTPQGAAPFDIRAVGVQSFPISATDNLLVFAVNTFQRFNTAAVAEVDIEIDSNGDGKPDYRVISYDLGLLNTGSFNGQVAVVVLNLSTGAIRVRYLAVAPTDGSTLLLPVRASDLGLSAANPRLSYQAVSFNSAGGVNAVPGTAKFNAFAPSITTGDFVTLAPGARSAVPIAINAAEFARTPALGVMVVDKESASGAPQASLLRLGADR